MREHFKPCFKSESLIIISEVVLESRVGLLSNILLTKYIMDVSQELELEHVKSTH